MKKWSFWMVSHKYPIDLGEATGNSKLEAFETLKIEKGYSNYLHIGRKIKGYISKESK